MAAGHEEARDDDIHVLTPPSHEELETDSHCPQADIFFRPIPDTHTENASYSALENAYVDLKHKYNRLRRRVDGASSMPTTRGHQATASGGCEVADCVRHSLQKDELLKADFHPPIRSADTPSSIDEVMHILQKLTDETSMLKEIVNRQTGTIRSLQRAAATSKSRADWGTSHYSRTHPLLPTNETLTQRDDVIGSRRYQPPLQPPSAAYRSHRSPYNTSSVHHDAPTPVDSSCQCSISPIITRQESQLDEEEDSWVMDFNALQDYEPSAVKMRCMKSKGGKLMDMMHRASPMKALGGNSTAEPKSSTTDAEVSDGPQTAEETRRPADLFGGPIVQGDRLNAVCDVINEFKFCDDEEPKTLISTEVRHPSPLESQDNCCPVCSAIFESNDLEDKTRHVNAHFPTEFVLLPRDSTEGNPG